MTDTTNEALSFSLSLAVSPPASHGRKKLLFCFFHSTLELKKAFITAELHIRQCAGYSPYPHFLSPGRRLVPSYTLKNPSPVFPLPPHSFSFLRDKVTLLKEADEGEETGGGERNRLRRARFVNRGLSVFRVPLMR